MEGWSKDPRAADELNRAATDQIMGKHKLEEAVGPPTARRF